MNSAVLGLLAGSGAMVISASVVLAYRIAQRRYTIGAILVTIAVVAVLLAWRGRSCPLDRFRRLDKLGLMSG